MQHYRSRRAQNNRRSLEGPCLRCSHPSGRGLRFIERGGETIAGGLTVSVGEHLPCRISLSASRACRSLRGSGRARQRRHVRGEPHRQHRQGGGKRDPQQPNRGHLRRQRGRRAAPAGQHEQHARLLPRPAGQRQLPFAQRRHRGRHACADRRLGSEHVRHQPRRPADRRGAEHVQRERRHHGPLRRGPQRRHQPREAVHPDRRLHAVANRLARDQ